MMKNNFQTLTELKSFLERKENYVTFNFPEIAKISQNLVFSKGNPESKIIIIGEAPGSDEDKRGIPFCGRCGKLLEKALKEHNIDQNSELYTINSIFWRPSVFNQKTKRFSNRPPTEDEINWCKEFVFEHIRLINPKKIICLGSYSFSLTQNFNEKQRKKIKISQIIGQRFQYFHNQSIEVYVNFHPAYILRNEKTLFKKYSDDLALLIKNCL
jgi:uracil-DNA glycosylase family 4